MVLARDIASLPCSVSLPQRVVILSIAKDLALAPARQGSLVPCGCRRAGSFLWVGKERNRRKPTPTAAPAARVRVPARGAPMAIHGLRRVSASHTLTLRALPSQPRRCRRGMKIKNQGQRSRRCC